MSDFFNAPPPPKKPRKRRRTVTRPELTTITRLLDEHLIDVPGGVQYRPGVDDKAIARMVAPDISADQVAYHRKATRGDFPKAIDPSKPLPYGARIAALEATTQELSERLAFLYVHLAIDPSGAP